MVQDTAIVTMDEIRLIRVGYNDLEWPWDPGREGQIVLADLVKYARMVWRRMTEFDR